MKTIQAQKMRNGLLLSVRTSGGEEQFLVPDDGSLAYKSFVEACDHALDGVKEAEESDAPEREFSNPGPVGDPDEEMGLGEAANIFLSKNPGIADFASRIFTGMNEAEKKRREGLRRREEAKRKQRGE
jgi:hypothetical protein